MKSIVKSKELTFREFVYRNRNIQREIHDLDLQIDPQIKNLVFTSQYYVAEIDFGTTEFKEMTLADMERGGLPIVVDLTLPQSQRIKELKIQQGNIMIATLLSTVTTIGQTEEWHLLNIQDIFRGNIALENLQNFM